MQYPVGMHFNPDTVRNEMFDFWAVALSPVAINKFFHTVLSGWIVGALFVLGNQLLVFIKETEYRIRFVKYQGQRYIRVGSLHPYYLDG